MNKILAALTIIFLISSCTAPDKTDIDYQFPKNPKDNRRGDQGTITDDGGILDFFGEKSKKSKGATIGVNSYLWRASLDTVSFMPLASADPFGGVIITDWYEDPKTPGERFKVNILILSTSLQADSVKVSVFKQRQDAERNWRDVRLAEKLAIDFEDLILTRARELKIKNLK
jgi:hypothetical protein